MASSCVKGGLGWILGTVCSPKSEVLERAALGGDGVTVLEMSESHADVVLRDVA